MPANTNKCDNSAVVFPITLIITGIVGWIASFGLTLERLHVMANPAATTACDISPFISCKSVMLSEQAALFGFPNPLIGIAAYFAPVVIGVAIFAGAKFKGWFWLLVIDFVVLMWVGAMPTDGIYPYISLIAATYWFAYFLVILPLLGVLEKPLPQPATIEEDFKSHYADPAE